VRPRVAGPGGARRAAGRLCYVKKEAAAAARLWRGGLGFGMWSREGAGFLGSSLSCRWTPADGFLPSIPLAIAPYVVYSLLPKNVVHIRNLKNSKDVKFDQTY
jgi:hypothetical protein